MTLDAIWDSIDISIVSCLTQECAVCEPKWSRAHRTRRNPCAIMVRNGHYIRQLLLKNIWPQAITPLKSDMKVALIERMLSGIKSYATIGTLCDRDLLVPETDLKAATQQALTESMEDPGDLCLSCAKAGCYTDVNNCGLNNEAACSKYE